LSIAARRPAGLFTGLSEQGRAFVREFLEPQRYSQMIEEWRVLTSTALATRTAGAADTNVQWRGAAG
jgi:hypothetical protein